MKRISVTLLLLVLIISIVYLLLISDNPSHEGTTTDIYSLYSEPDLSFSFEHPVILTEVVPASNLSIDMERIGIRDIDNQSSLEVGVRYIEGSYFDSWLDTVNASLSQTTFSTTTIDSFETITTTMTGNNVSDGIVIPFIFKRVDAYKPLNTGSYIWISCVSSFMEKATDSMVGACERVIRTISFKK